MIVCNGHGALSPDDARFDPDQAALAERTNKHHRRGTADEMLEGADLLLGLSGLGAVSAAAVRRMAPDAIVFALANPVPEIHPEEIQDDVAIIATGRSDDLNQINNVLAFPGVFKGALEVRAGRINEPMKLAAAYAIDRVPPSASYTPTTSSRACSTTASPRWWRRPSPTSPPPPASRAGNAAPAPTGPATRLEQID